MFHFLFRSCLRTRGRWVGQGRSALCIPRIMVRPICLAIAIIHYLSVGFPHKKGRRPFISDGSRFQND